jgi:hypothetical protein
MPLKLLVASLHHQGQGVGTYMYLLKNYRLSGARSGHFWLDSSSITRRSTVQKRLLLEVYARRVGPPWRGQPESSKEQHQCRTVKAAMIWEFSMIS